MSEETQQEGGILAQIKTQIVAGVGILLAGLSTMFLDEVKSIVGIEDEEVQTEQVDATAGQMNQQSVNVQGPTINLTIPEQKTQTVIREVAVPAEPETVKVEKEDATSRFLKYKKN